MYVVTRGHRGPHQAFVGVTACDLISGSFHNKDTLSCRCLFIAPVLSGGQFGACIVCVCVCVYVHAIRVCAHARKDLTLAVVRI